MLGRFTIALGVLFFSACATIESHNYDAVVGKQASLSPNHFSSVQAALDAAPSVNNKPWRIYLTAGDYYEKITIAKPNIHLIGADKNTTRIYYDAYASQQATDPGSTPGQIWGTTGSATLMVRAADVRVKQLTIENTFDFITNDALTNNDPKRVANTQSVALHLDNGSDRFLARDIRVLSHHDTLFVNSGSSWFDKSLIAGTIDFIFGKGNALFTESEIKTLGRGKVTNPHGYIAAPSTNIANDHGLTFIDCKLTRAPDVPNNSTPLARPWHPTTQFIDGRYADPNAIGKAVFINTWMDEHIAADGWSTMSGTAKDGKKIQFYPDDSRFFEYNSSGPGAVANNKRRQLTEAQAKAYTREKIIGEWQ